MNMSKTIKHATDNKLNVRKFMRKVCRNEAIARARGNMLALQVAIHADIAPVLAAMRHADNILENCTKGRPATGTNETEDGSLDKYGHVYTLRPCAQLGDLASANEPHSGAAYLAGLDKGEETSRNVADNN